MRGSADGGHGGATRGHAVRSSSPATPTSACSTGRSIPAAAADPQPIDALSITEPPRLRHRILNHWDNLNGTVERGYAGGSLWDWHKLPDYKAPRYTDYARANASLGINGTVLTNVNANATSLTRRVPRQGRRARRRVPPVRHPRLPDRALQRADRDRRAENRRPARAGGPGLVDTQGRRDLQGDPRLRRLPREGQLRGAARAAGLQAHARRRRQHAGRRLGASRRHRHVARLRLCGEQQGGPRTSRRTRSSCRSTARSAPTSCCR